MQEILKRFQKRLLPVEKNHTSMCALCRGTKLLCGKTRCPVIVRFHSKAKARSLVNTLAPHWVSLNEKRNKDLAIKL